MESHAGGRSLVAPPSRAAFGTALGTPGADPRNRSAARTRATAPSARSAVTRGLQALGVSNAYALHVANQLENVHGGSGEALTELNRSMASLSARFAAQHLEMPDVVKALKDAANAMKANRAEVDQIRTLVDGFVRYMGPNAAPTGPTGTVLAAPALR